MSDRRPTLQEKIAQLRASFLGQLPVRMAELRRLHEQVRAHPQTLPERRELRRLCHSLKGTGASFGFLALSAAAGEVERLLEDSPASASVVGEALGQRFAALEAEARRLDGETPAPAVTPGFELAAPSVAGEEGERRRLVYLCDDDAEQVAQLAVQLACFGYEAVTFTALAALREGLARCRPDVLVLDIVFPEGEGAGLDLASELARREEAPVPIIFISCRSDFDARLRAVQGGGSAYFPKPVRAMELVEVLDALTGPQEPVPFRVLLVDDDPAAASYHAAILEEAGMAPRSLTDPTLVLEALAEFNPDLVLMDMYMPGCTGRDLAKVIRQMPHHLSLPIVYLSSETDADKQFSALRVGADGFLTKPVVPAQLAQAVALRAERMRTLRSLMMRDSLTGLFNHTTIKQLLDTATKGAGRAGGKLAFAMIDVDLFKRVNDTQGHPTGDQVLLALARLLQQRLRQSDIVGRYGGEEFAVILNGVTRERAVELLDGLREDFSKVRFYGPKGEFSCTFSCGIADFPEVADAEGLCEEADQALYRAKHGGRNRVEAFRPGARESA
jgi:diguanylate cyclase (GGDEF)-like protein